MKIKRDAAYKRENMYKMYKNKVSVQNNIKEKYATNKIQWNLDNPT